MANRFWVNGTGTWDASSTTNWAATSGGAPGASAPVAADTVTFDSNSGSGTCTVQSGATCATLSVNTSSVDISLNSNLSLTGSVTLTAGTIGLGSFTLSCNLFSSNNSNTRTINFGTGKISITGGGGALGYWDFRTATNFSLSGNPIVEFTYAGSTSSRIVRHGDTAGGSASNAVSFNVLAGSDSFSIISSAHIKNLNFTGFSGSASLPVTLYGNIIISPTQTVASSASQGIVFSGASVTQTATTNGVTIDRPITINSSNGVVEFQDALTQGASRNFVISSGTLALKSAATSVVGVFSTSGSSQKFIKSTTPGSVATLSQATGTVSASNLTITDIAATGGATWNAFTTSGNVDGGNNSGWDFSSQLGKFMYARRKNKRILP